MNFVGYILLAAVVGWVVSRFQRDIETGMASFLAFAVFLPELLGIPLPGDLPQITAVRILLLVAWYFLARDGYLSDRGEPVPYLKWLVLFGLAQVVSLCCGIVFVAGLKECIDYALEAILFFILVTSYVQKGGDPMPLLRGLARGVAGAGALVVVQRYCGINFIPYSVPADLARIMERSDISSTYPHRILFGYGMAMGAPLCIGLAAVLADPRRRFWMHVMAVLCIVTCYFSNSRGPWLGMAIGLAVMVLVGGRSIRKKLAIVALLAGTVLILRPGVRDTLTRLTDSTFESDSLKGASYQVRWRLWYVAWSEIRKSPERFLFGYGPVSTETMDLTSYWAGEEGSTSAMTKIGHTSWDNNYAANLIELGVTGFVLQAVVFAAIAAALFRNWLRADPETRVVRAGVGCACLVFMFAMSNVFIFSAQLKYLFWALAAIGSNGSWSLEAAPDGEEAEAEPEEMAEAAAP